MVVAGTLPDALAAAARGAHGYRFVSARGVESTRSYGEMQTAALRVAGSLPPRWGCGAAISPPSSSAIPNRF